MLTRPVRFSFHKKDPSVLNGLVVPALSRRERMMRVVERLLPARRVHEVKLDEIARQSHLHSMIT